MSASTPTGSPSDAAARAMGARASSAAADSKYGGAQHGSGVGALGHTFKLVKKEGDYAFPLEDDNPQNRAMIKALSKTSTGREILAKFRLSRATEVTIKVYEFCVTYQLGKRGAANTLNDKQAQRCLSIITKAKTAPVAEEADVEEETEVEEDEGEDADVDSDVEAARETKETAGRSPSPAGKAAGSPKPKSYAEEVVAQVKERAPHVAAAKTPYERFKAINYGPGATGDADLQPESGGWFILESHSSKNFSKASGASRVAHGFLMVGKGLLGAVAFVVLGAWGILKAVPCMIYDASQADSAKQEETQKQMKLLAAKRKELAGDPKAAKKIAAFSTAAQAKIKEAYDKELLKGHTETFTPFFRIGALFESALHDFRLMKDGYA